MSEQKDYKEQDQTFMNQQKMLDDDEDSNFLSDLDFIKFLIVAKKNFLWVLLIFIACITASFLYLRYTSQVYKSEATLKLEIKTKGNIISNAEMSVNPYQINDLSGEVELIKSNLVLTQVAQLLKLDISYFGKGNILNEERYNGSPFIIEDYQIFDDTYFGQNFYVDIIDGKQYKLIVGNAEEGEVYLFGEVVKNSKYTFVVNLNFQFTTDLESTTFFFVINTPTSQLKYLNSNLVVQVLNPEAGTLSISFSDNNALKAHDVVNAIDSIYLREGLAEKYKSSEQTIRYLEDHLKDNEKNMEKFEQDVQNQIIKNKSLDLKSEVIKNIIEVEKIDKLLVAIRQKQAKLDEIFEIITSDKIIEDFVIVNPDLNLPQINELILKYNELKKQRELLMVSNKENTMVLRINNMELTSLKKQATKIISQVKNTVFNEVAELNLAKQKLEDAIYSATPKDNNFKKTQRMYSFYERLYLLAFDKKIDFEIAKAAAVPSFRVLSPPSYSKIPIYPVRTSVYMYAAITAFVLSLLLVVLQYFLHNTIDNIGELEKGTIAPVLGFVPKYLKGKMEFSSLVIDKSPKGPITEALRTIRTNIEFLLPNKNKRLISVTSTISGEGKTFVSINLAGVIALSGQKVVILDLDMRKPKIHKAFNDENDKGMSTILINKHDFKECVKSTSLPNLFYIPSGPIPPNPSELIISKEFDILLDNLKKEYDTVLLDSPPVGLVTDGVLIMQKVDLPIYVIRAEYSKKGFEKNVNRLITKNNIRKLSIILNDFSNLSGYGYGYKYGYGYGYGYYSNEDSGENDNRIVSLIRKYIWKK